MAMNVSSACFSVFSCKKPNRIRAVASEDFATTAALKADTEDKLKLGGSELKVKRLGIGAWSWGDTSYWNNFQWDDKKLKAAKAAFNESLDCGITFSIQLKFMALRFIKERQKDNPGEEVVVATKFAALPWRFGRQSVISALKDSLNRLGLSSVDLYQLHWPGIWGNEGYIDGLGDAVEQGLVKAVGVSNYSEKRLRDAYERLKKRGIPLASNQVNYSLIYRLPEQNGVKAACDELGVTLIAYCPIAQGALTGKYKPENPPSGPRGQIYTPEFLTKLQPLLIRIKEIGGNYGKTPTQSVYNNLIIMAYTSWENLGSSGAQLVNSTGECCANPRSQNAAQAEEFAGALGWRLSNEEVDELRSLASEISPVIGFPVEKL
ncbi:hypothetical protein CXB51_004719 [Gossypium anomalum]|uniref:NADP-dependent oxidoreductase domain-containing protein n=1 Tax=Gossypium anomalum TaxID=47600 RepID=A0A8J5ZH01_9ROSI|nr:hypothetical protein CXB51_004719 [Gossypium anomalum]